MPASLSPVKAQSQEPSSHAPSRSRNRRSRPQISCLECRRKKLRCDRVQPCVQCKKSGKEALCVFVNKPPRSSSTGRPGTDITLPPLPGPKSEQTTPIHPRDYGHDGGKLEGFVENRCSVSAIPERLHQGPDGQISQSTSLGCIRVKCGRSRYLGLGDRMAMLGYVGTSFQR